MECLLYTELKTGQLFLVGFLYGDIGNSLSKQYVKKAFFATSGQVQ